MSVCVGFFYDILIYSKSHSEHLLHLRLILDLLKSNQFYAKLSKCVFAVESVRYLGHILSATCVSPDQEKIKHILDWPEPQFLQVVCSPIRLTCLSSHRSFGFH